MEKKNCREAWNTSALLFRHSICHTPVFSWEWRKLFCLTIQEPAALAVAVAAPKLGRVPFAATLNHSHMVRQGFPLRREPEQRNPWAFIHPQSKCPKSRVIVVSLSDHLAGPQITMLSKGLAVHSLLPWASPTQSSTCSSLCSCTEWTLQHWLNAYSLLNIIQMKSRLALL